MRLLDSLFSSATGLSDSVARRVAIEAASHIRIGRLEATFPGGEARSFGRPGAEPKAKIDVKDNTFFRRVLSGGEVAVGETYMDGLWSTPDLTALLVLGILNREHAPPALKRLQDVSRSASHRLRQVGVNTAEERHKGTPAASDIGSEFYRLFLDDTLTNSCAVFASPDESLEQAQRNKYGLVCEKAALSTEGRVLDIGAGWGGFAIFAAQNYGCRVTAVTVSSEEHRIASELVEEARLKDQVQVRLCDYRDVSGAYEAITSIEMMQALGAGHLETYMRKCDDVLLPGGRMVLQTLAVPDKVFEEQQQSLNWMQKYIVPGGLVPSLEALQRAATSTGLSISDVEDIGQSYPPTLREWRRRFSENLPAVRSLGLDERFVRMWEFYLCASEAASLTGSTQVLQVVFEKPLH